MNRTQLEINHWSRRFGRIIFILVWTGLLFLIATNIQAGWLYVVIAFLMVLVAASVAAPVLALRGIEVRLLPPELCERGRSAGVTVVLLNRSRRVRRMVRVGIESDDLEFGPDAFLAVVLPPEGSVSFTAGAVPLRRGRLAPGRAWMYCANPVGLYVARRRVPLAAEMLAYPRIDDSDSAGLRESPLAGSARNDRFTQPDDPFHYRLREYVPGDSLRHIHWKLTAKRGEPIVRVHDHRTLGRSAILVDNLRGGYPPGGEEAFESVLEDAAAIAFRKVFREGAAVTLEGTAAPRICVESREEWETALRWLALIRLEDAGAGTDRDDSPPDADFILGPSSGLDAHEQDH